jgi:glycerol-3-phosphate dehydrogenase (NAD(P)+)
MGNMWVKPKKITVIGGGAWGTTLAKLAGQQGHTVQIWSRRSPDDLGTLVKGADLIVSATAISGVRSVVQQLYSPGSNNLIPPGTIVVTATKGLDTASDAEAMHSGGVPAGIVTPSQIWQSAFPQLPIVVLSGPNLSQEIQQGLPAATVVSSSDADAAQQVQAALSSTTFRVYTNADPLGVELGGTLKNVIAIAAGTCDGLNLGTNAKAALVTRGLAEMIRVGTFWGAQVETFYGLSGLGDLLATCNSVLSRNYQVGYRLAQGETLPEILKHLSGTAEGMNTSRVLMQLTQNPEQTIPISHQVVRLLQGEITPQAAVTALMLRDVKPEFSLAPQ